MTDRIEAAYNHWANWAQLCRVDGRWRIHVRDGLPTVTTRRVRWWNPLDLVRFPIHWYWVRKFEATDD